MSSDQIRNCYMLMIWWLQRVWNCYMLMIWWLQRVWNCYMLMIWWLQKVWKYEVWKCWLRNLRNGKEVWKPKDFRWIWRQTKIMETDAGSARSSGRWSYSVCKKGVGSNSMFCDFCEQGAKGVQWDEGLFLIISGESVQVRLGHLRDYQQKREEEMFLYSLLGHFFSECMNCWTFASIIDIPLI